MSSRQTTLAYSLPHYYSLEHPRARAEGGGRRESAEVSDLLVSGESANVFLLTNTHPPIHGFVLNTPPPHHPTRPHPPHHPVPVLLFGLLMS
jgi:hypothetical protein